MKIFFSSWQGVTLLVGAVVIIILTLVLFLLPAPQQVAEAPTNDAVPGRADTIDQALEENGTAHVVFGPLYATLDETGREFGVLIMASGGVDEETLYQLAIAGTEASNQEQATYTFATGVIVTDVSVSASGSIIVSTVTFDGEEDEVRFMFENGDIVVESAYE